jgi:hypothetical protein
MRASCSKENTMTDVDKLLYEKANTYRLHADNLRWTLLGGYGAFFAAIMFQLKDDGSVEPNIQIVVLFLALFGVSIFYLFMLAVQSWYYNLFSAYVEDCEKKMINGQRLISLSEFTGTTKKYITPLHPAFSFAIYVIALTSLGFLLPLVRYLLFYFKIDAQQNIAWLIGLAILWLAVYIGVFNLLFRRWQGFTYPIIAFLFTDQLPSSKEKKH